MISSLVYKVRHYFYFIVQHTAGLCFCTLALGENYCNLALELAKDLEEYSPNTYFLILTDKPQHFHKPTNILAFKHQQKSIGCYHDKRFAIAKALSLFNSCIFIDADMRILAAVPNRHLRKRRRDAINRVSTKGFR